MPTQPKKWSFENGNLSGFEVNGRCHASTSIWTGSSNLHAHAGLFFAVIDDPTMTNPDGTRLPGSPAPIKTNGYRKETADGFITIGVDGARLSLKNLSIPTGAIVRFWWAFIGTDRRPGCNDFGLFEALDASGDILHREWLCESRQRRFMPWTVFQYENDVAKAVELRWVASNGRLVLDEDEVVQSFHRAFACTLLLDAIEIV